MAASAKTSADVCAGGVVTGAGAGATDGAVGGAETVVLVSVTGIAADPGPLGTGAVCR